MNGARRGRLVTGKARWLAAALTLVVLSGCSASRAQSPKEIAAGPTPVEATFQDAGNLSMAESLQAESPEDYRLGPGDTVEISLLRHPEFQAPVTVGTTGKILYYLVGEVPARGLTLLELREALRSRLTAFVREPEVLVRVTEYRSKRVYALGQVHNPGFYPLRGPTTLVELVAMAGGFTDRAFLRGAYLVRDGKLTIINFPALFEKGNMRENVSVRADDIIFIPDKTDRKVFLLGEVKQPTAIALERDLTLLEAIAVAGGLTPNSDWNSVLLLRGGLSNPSYVELDVKEMLRGKDRRGDLLLEQGDIIYVASTPIADVAHFMAQISTILSPISDNFQVRYLIRP
jgi:polysaccharide export outer membrane protein